MDNTNKVKHLEMIENLIERMAKNCFQLKAWTMALVALIGGLAAKDSERKFIIIAFIPIIVFWLLDTYYLRIERQYRMLYKTITAKDDDKIDFSMELSQIQNLSIQDSKKICFLNCLFSVTELIFYLPITLSLFVIIHTLNIFSFIQIC